MALRISGKKADKYSDEDLLTGYINEKSLDLLGILYERYMPMVYGVCLKYYKERERSQDAVMGIFEKLVTELDRHKVENFRSWLYVLTKNYCLMELRQINSERSGVRSLEKEEKFFMENDYELHPIDRNDNNIDKALEYCIDRLKDEQQKCIRLFYYESRSYREIADLLRMDELKVKSLLQNGKRNLKICLESTHERE